MRRVCSHQEKQGNYIHNELIAVTTKSCDHNLEADMLMFSSSLPSSLLSPWLSLLPCHSAISSSLP